ncbi:MAG: M48 family metalloprotease [Pseudomonadales bacterium]|nr:M48 family metalloprotease [Pseudomonadales bacterium]
MNLFERLFAIASVVIITSGCAPRPDPENKAELARVYGECSYNLNTQMLDLPVLPNDDPRVVAITGIVDELVTSRYQHFPWKIHTQVFDTIIPNAFTTGGGYLAAFGGVFAMADDEAALAGVIAHELAHMAKQDPMELANYLEELLAYRFEQSGIENVATGVALKTVVDFCLAIPGLVSWQWKKDLVTDTNNDAHPVFNDVATPYIPFLFSENDESPYSAAVRDPLNIAQNSRCNDKLRETYDEFVINNPEFYLDNFPNREALPEIPDSVYEPVLGNSTFANLWRVQPWLAFQYTTFQRYAECQADEAATLNLFSSGYRPLALNDSFDSILEIFDPNEAADDWRFKTHPSLAQRIEDIQHFISLNNETLPSLEEIANDSGYASYITMADNIPLFEQMRDEAREVFTLAGAASEEFEPITVADLAMLLMDLDSAGTQTAEKAQSTNVPATRCDKFKKVYQHITGKSALGCFAE